MAKDAKKIAVIGYGAMAKSLRASLQAHSEFDLTAALLPPDVPVEPADEASIKIFRYVEDLVSWGPSVVVECASHVAVQEYAEPLLNAGIDVIVASIGSLADKEFLAKLEAAASRGGSRLSVVSGAIGGLDVLRSARIAGLNQVIYSGSKPPNAWKGTPADETFDLGALIEPTVIFEGTAAEAARLYPKNANVTAAVALAGVGFDDTKVTLVADPDSKSNRHSVEAVGAFGRFTISLENNPLPDNPKTSWLAALSIEQCLVRQFQNIEL